MSVNSGPKLPVNKLILSLDAFRVVDWNLTKSEWTDSSSNRSRGVLKGLGAGLTFDNTQGYFNFALNNTTAEVDIVRNTVDLGTGDFAIEAWVYPTSFASETQILTFNTASIGTLRINTSGAIQFSSTSYTTSIAGWTATLNQWNHIFLTRKDNVAYGYLNGNLIGTSTGFNNSISVGQFFIRKASASSGAVRIRTVRLWGRALTDNEVKTTNIFFKDRAYSPVPTTGLVASTLISNNEYTVNQDFQFKPVTGVAGGGGYTYSVSPSLPSGITLNTDTGVISGRASTLSNTTYTMTVRDRIQSQTTTTFVLKINPEPLTVIVPNEIFILGVNSTVSIQPVIGSRGFGTYTYGISPALPTSSQPPSLTLNSSSGIISGVPTGYLLNQQYTITVTDQASQTAQGVFRIIVEAQPISAVSLEPLVSIFTNNAVASIIPVSASGGESPVSYSILPALPSGLSFNTSNGAISGTATAALNQTQYTVTVTDSVSQTASNTFFLEVKAALYNFTSFTFTNAGATGRFGPTLAQCQTAYSGAAFLSGGYFSVPVQGFQHWTVPVTGVYAFTVRGANGVASTGANSGASGGQGIIQTFQTTLTQGTVLRLIVGQSGTATSANGGGGGASAVLQSPYNTEASIIAIAGGGGGRRGGASGLGIPGASAITFNGFGTRNDSQSTAAIGTITNNSVSNNGWTPNAATLGQGGPGATNGGWGDGGAGFNGNGFDDNSGGTVVATSLSTTAIGGGNSAPGGFGGGADGAGSNGGGGGGGFTGGSGGWTAGGGGTFIAAGVSGYAENFDGNITVIGGTSTLFHGYITIAKL